MSFWRDIQSLNWMRRGEKGDACFLFFCIASSRQALRIYLSFNLVSLFQVGYPTYSGAENVSAPTAEDEQEEGHSGKRTRAALLLSRPWRWYVSRWIFPPCALKCANVLISVYFLSGVCYGDTLPTSGGFWKTSSQPETAVSSFCLFSSA